MKKSRKNPLLVLLPLTIMSVVVPFILTPWMRRISLLDSRLSMLAHANVAVWLIVLWWALHHLVYQLTSLFRGVANPLLATPHSDVRIAVLYLTCDDFQKHACESCVQQNYPADHFQVIICDDSQETKYLKQIDDFALEYPQVTVMRRITRVGFKAGNLNHAIAKVVKEPWVVIIDADQTLPPTYLAALAGEISHQGSQVAFVQMAHEPDHLRPGESAKASVKQLPTHTAFQQAMGYEILTIYQRDLSLRNRCGFLPLLGHGAGVRRDSWEKIGGFPELVSEDYAFALAASTNGLAGVYSEAIHSWEAFPKDFGAFLVRLCKFASGGAELFRRAVLWRFIFSGNVSVVEKLDFLMLLLWYPLMPALVANGFLSAYVCHRFWELEIPVLHPFLPYLFLSMLLLTMLVLMSVTRHPWLAARYWLWASAIYSASMPVAACCFLRYLFGSRPSFERTPKGDQESSSFNAISILMVLFGLVTLGLGKLWWSPFSPVIAAYGIAYVTFPLYRCLNAPFFLGQLIRVIICLPGGLLLWGLYTMWQWGRL